MAAAETSGPPADRKRPPTVQSVRLQGDVEHTYKGAPKHIGVVLEDRAGGRKHITRITAMEAFAIDPEELATALQRRFQANAR